MDAAAKYDDPARSVWKETDEAVEIEVRRPLDKVIPVRLAADTWDELRREARELGIGPTTLARMWVLERLSARRRERDQETAARASLTPRVLPGDEGDRPPRGS